jgi:HEAT repeat protein
MKVSRGVGRLWLICALAPALALPQASPQNSDFERYREGQADLDGLQWQKALSVFQGLSSGSAQAAGALYWKAFAQYKLGQGREALASVAELRESFAGSGWLMDAESLAAAIPGNAGRDAATRKESPADERQRALADRVREDPAHAVNLLREAAFSVDLPGVRQKAFYSLSRDGSPEARAIVLQVAHGAANPDLQSYAISQLGKSDPQAVFELYKTVDSNAKSFVLAVLSSNRESARLMRIAAGETSDELRYQALSSLVEVGSEAQVAQSLQFENAADVKMLIEKHLANLHQWVAEQLQALQTAQDPRERRIGAVGLTRGGDESTARALVAAYSAEKDPEVKGAIVFALSERKDFSTLESMEKKETDPELKQRMSMALENARPK